MLVLSRQRDQTIIIGDDIEITIVDIRGDKVRIGINAPRNVTVHRKEIYDAVKRENQSASSMKPQDLPVAPPNPHAGNGADPFLAAAIEEARMGLTEGGLPIGAVLVRGSEIIARGHNRRLQSGNPMAHAEIDCLSRAGLQKTYKDTVLYSTLMPCHLCGGAIMQFGIPRVVVGESVNFAGAGFQLRKHGVQVIDLHDHQCIQMMADYIKAHPDIWHADIGV